MSKKNNNAQTLSDLAISTGADLFGIADLRPVRSYIIKQGGDWLKVFSSAVVIGIKLLNSVVDNLDPRKPADFSIYGWHVYRTVSPLVDQIAFQIAHKIEKNGHKALPIPSSQYRSPGERISVFSHKLAGHLAGLGWIGKNCLLITPEFGPRVRFASILTDYELESGIPLEGKCGNCQICIEVCPVNALIGAEFSESEGVENRINVEACGSYRDGKDAGSRRGANVCALCLARCPKGH
jgi:epoxyqueuosine reductase QueG